VRKLFSKYIGSIYHRWYYKSKVWHGTTFLGVTTLKSVSDMWNYQEIIAELKPSLLVEFGTRHGGSALYFAMVLSAINAKCKVLSVDVDHSLVSPLTRNHANIELMLSSSTDQKVRERIRELRRQYAGPVFFILDSDHSKDHVFAELMLVKDVTLAGDYVIVEDSNINGHPVLPRFGPGPYEAIQAYEQRFPGDYEHDEHRENKFGFTFAVRGFLVRK